MPRTPRPPRSGWYPRPELLAAIAIVAALLLVAGAAIGSRRGGGAVADAGVRVTRDGSPTPAIPAAAAPATRTATPSATSTATAAPTATTTVTTAATETPIPTEIATTAPAVIPTGTPAPAGPIVTLRPETVGTGNTLLVVVPAPSGESGSVLFAGESLPLSRDGKELWTVVGVPLATTAGPGVLTVTLRDAAGAPAASADAEYTVVHVDRPIDNLTLTTQEASILTAEAGQQEARLRDAQFSQFDRGRRWSGLFRWPVAGPITTYFGQGRRINGGPPGEFHSGTDIAAPEGAPVVAAAPGRVAWTGAMPIRGNTIVIDHGAGVMTSYSHLSEIDVTVDQMVLAGVTIGKVGHTGLATGPHLHWELLIYGTDVDAIEWTKTDFMPPGVEPLAAPASEPTATPSPQ